jgi:formylglycine-generating enzyme required for sulfatase activity
MNGDRICFLIMPISGTRSIKAKDWNFLMERIVSPVVKEFGYTVLRADSVNRGGSIIRDIVANVVQSDLAVVDLTGLNPNVLYELGVRHALSNRTILLTQNLRSLPFDLRDLRTIEYSMVAEGPEELATRLRKTITELEDAPADYVDNPVFDYLKANRHILPDPISRAVAYQTYLMRPEDSYRQEEEQLPTFANRMRQARVSIPAGPVASGLREYEIAEIANLFNVADKARHQTIRRLVEVERPFAMCKFPVTNAEYKLFLNESATPPPDHWRNGWYYPLTRRDHPVSGVTYTDAMSYCEWISAHSGERYRLPKETEWELAARRTLDINYPWGDTISLEMCNCELAGLGHTTSVFEHVQYPSQCGIVDMSGNVWEWCIPNAGSDLTITHRNYAALRGGSFDSTIFEVKVGYRELFQRDYTHVSIGFRCVIDP